MKTNRIKLAMIGCGDISGAYLKHARSTAAAEIVRVMDVNAEFARDRGSQFDLPHTTDYQAILDDPGIAGVIISVPHYLHAPLSIQALKAGKHVLCDKPIATTVADGLKMIQTAAETKCKLSISYGSRQSLSSQRARALVAAGAIGEIIAIIIVEGGLKPESYWSQGWSRVVTTDWRASREKAGGGVMLMNASHRIDNSCFISGLSIVSARGLSETFLAKVEVEDTAAAAFRLSNGGMMNVFSGSSIHGGLPTIHSIVGSRGQLRLAGAATEHGIYVAEPWGSYAGGTFSPLLNEAEQQQPVVGYDALLAEFAAYVNDAGANPCPPREALMVLEAILGCFRSSATDTVIAVDDWQRSQP